MWNHVCQAELYASSGFGIATGETYESHETSLENSRETRRLYWHVEPDRLVL